MSTSPISRLVRPAILLVAGMLLGQGALTVAAPSSPAATTQTRVTSCSGFGFHPIDSLTGYEWVGRLLYRTTKAGDGWFMCDVPLPNHAVVTKVRFTVDDDYDLGGFEYCGLVRTALAVTGSVQVVGMALSGTGVAAETGTKRYSTTSIQNATVDNGAFAYLLQCRMVFDPAVLSHSGSTFGIIGADVTYRISAANG